MLFTIHPIFFLLLLTLAGGIFNRLDDNTENILKRRETFALIFIVVFVFLLGSCVCFFIIIDVALK